MKTLRQQLEQAGWFNQLTVNCTDEQYYANKRPHEIYHVNPDTGAWRHCKGQTVLAEGLGAKELAKELAK